jgi:tRNA threonylcarbamoyladenosine biosynthesis protein TsaB
MSLSIIIQSTYSLTQGGLYSNGNCIATTPTTSQASTSLIPLLHDLITENNIRLESLSFMGIYQGPGPFTALRVLLASANGIAFAQNIPLVGVDGLDALLEEYTDNKFAITIALLNAYNKDTYFGIQHHQTILRKGYDNINALLTSLKAEFPAQQIRFIGQGVELYRENIKDYFADFAYIPEPLPEAPTLDMIAKKAYSHWHAGTTTKQLLPLYLKTMQYKKSIQ